MKKNDLSHLKVGDKVWSVQTNEAKITYIHNNILIEINGDNECYMDGRYLEDDKHPTVFESKENFLEYWGINTNNEKREFTKQAAIALLNRGEMPSQSAIETAIQFTEMLFKELDKTKRLRLKIN